MPSHESSQRDAILARGYPLAVITPANHYFLNPLFVNTTRQQQQAGAATLLIHPDDAAPREIATWDEMRVANARGAFFAVADVSDLRSGVIASTKGRPIGTNGMNLGNALQETAPHRPSR